MRNQLSEMRRTMMIRADKADQRFLAKTPDIRQGTVVQIHRGVMGMQV